MANVNPGPAIAGIPNSLNVLTPVNNGPTGNTTPQGANALRMIMAARGISLSSVGDYYIPMINTSFWCATQMVTSNALVNGASGTIATASVGIYTAAAAGGTGIKTASVLSGQTTNAFVYVQAASSIAAAWNLPGLYVHVTTALAGGTCDLFLYGYDLS